MKGLLVKDFRLFFHQKQFLATILLIVLLFTMSGQRMQFITAYVTMLCFYFTISTVNYDEFNNGYAFLFTLPVSRRGYVLEKYLYALLLGGSAWLLTSAGGALFLYLSNPSTDWMEEWIAGAAGILITMWLMISIMLPVQFKFGAEKGRLSLIMLVVLMFGVLSVAGRMQQYLPQGIKQINLPQFGMAGWIFAGTAVILALTALSVLISVHILEKKQF